MRDTLCTLPGGVESPGGYRFFHPRLSIHASNGFIYTGTGASWVIFRRGHDCSIADSITVDAPQADVTAAQKSAIRVKFRELGVDSAFTGDDRFGLKVPAFGRLIFQPNGQLWAISYAAPYARADSVTVFSPNGRFVGRQRLPDRFRLYSLTDSTAIGLRFDEDEVAKIVAFRLGKP